MIKLVSQYYDAADASIDYKWVVAIAFASQACSLHHKLDHTFFSLTHQPPPVDLSLSTNIIITDPHIHIRTSSLQVRLVSRHGTLHTRDMSIKDNIANSDIPNIDIPTWFDLNRLPYNDVIVTKL